jgi:hypothetical protein
METPRLLCDRDLIFNSNFGTYLFLCLGNQLAHSSSYHPQFDVQTKILNKYMELYLLFFESNKHS